MIASPEMIAAALNAYSSLNSETGKHDMALRSALNAALSLVPDRLAAEREAGRREGIEAAAKHVEKYGELACLQPLLRNPLGNPAIIPIGRTLIPDAIRALRDTPADGGES